MKETISDLMTINFLEKNASLLNFFGNTLEELEKSVVERISENRKKIEKELKELFQEVRRSQEMITSKEWIEKANVGDLEKKRIFFLSWVQPFDNLIYAWKGAFYLSQKYQNRIVGELERKLREAVDNLMEWFYIDLNSWRLILYNDVRNQLPDRDELFPWYFLEREENPLLWNKIIDKIITGMRFTATAEEIVALNEISSDVDLWEEFKKKLKDAMIIYGSMLLHLPRRK